MNDRSEKITQLHEKSWTLAAIADELGVTVNAVEKWKAGDRYPSNAKLVLNALDGLARRRRIPKQRRYSRPREVVMSRNSIVPFHSNESLDPSTPLPLHVARLWNFPLQCYQLEDQEYFSIKDWIVGLTGSTRPGHTWENFKNRHKGNLPLTKGMSYAMPDGRTFTMDFTIDEGLYRIAVELKITKTRPALKAIKEFLAKAGVFLDEARRDPEGAAERLSDCQAHTSFSSGEIRGMGCN